MKRQEQINKIVKYSARFIEEVKLYSTQNLYDINMHSENFLIPILNTAYDIKLENLNNTQKKNFPSIDLADFNNRVAFQITSTPALNKIFKTLDTFFKYDLHKYFDVVYIYILTERQKSYSNEKINLIVKNQFHFEIDEHILDNSKLIQKINNLSLEKISYISRIFEHEFSDIQLEIRDKKFKSGYLLSSNENIYCNILKLTIPSKIYSAELFLDEESILNRINIWRVSKGWEKINKLKDKKKLLRNELIYKNIYSVDWLYWDGRFYTFRNLYLNKEPYTKIIDRGTIESFDSKEFCQIKTDNLRMIKNLLRNGLIQDCFFKGLEWVSKKSLLRFKIDQKNKGPKAISWIGKNKSIKTVIFEIKNKEKEHVICYRHLAFKPSFEQIDDTWYLMINSTWSFTNPGGKQISRFEDSYLSGIKRLEGNSSVYYFYRFWSYFLCYKDLFSRKEQILILEPNLPLKFSPSIDDSKWLPLREIKSSDNETILKADTELSLNLFD